MNRRIALGAALMRIRPAPLAAFLKAILWVRRIEHRTVEGTFWIDPASYVGATLLRTNAYEPALLATIKRRLRRGDTFVDVGANEGYFSVIAARTVAPGGRVLAIEPQRRVQSVIRRNLELNDCRNVTVIRAAISDCTGVAQLHLTPSMNNSGSSLMRPTRYALRRESVPLVTLEEVWCQAGLTRCALMKIDIEGWEYEAVLGSQSLFRNGLVDAIALELHPHLLASRGLDGGHIVHFLNECGYRSFAGAGHLLLVRE